MEREGQDALLARETRTLRASSVRTPERDTPIKLVGKTTRHEHRTHEGTSIFDGFHNIIVLRACTHWPPRSCEYVNTHARPPILAQLKIRGAADERAVINYLQGDDCLFGSPVSDRYLEAGVVTLPAKTAWPYNYCRRSNRPIDNWFYRRGRDSICWKE